MFTILRATTAFAAISLALGANSALADFASFSIPVQAVTKASGATGTSTIGFPATGTPSIFMNFILPVDYVTNGEVRVVLYFQSPTAPCTARIRPVQLLRTRPEGPLANSLSGVNGGSANVNIATGTIKTKTITLSANATLVDQRPGDSFNLQIQRDADDAADTCAGVVAVHGINIRYETP